MKKVLLLALGALLATSVSAQGVKRGQKEVFLLKRGDKVLVIKDMRKVPGREFRGDRRQADFRREQFRGDFRKGQFRQDFRKKDFRRFAKGECPKCRKFQKRHMRR